MQGLVIVVKGRGSGRIAGAVAEKSFIHLRTDIDVLQAVLESVNMYERLVGWDEPDPELFRLLSMYLTLADGFAATGKKEKVFLLTEGFLFQLFAHLGYTLETGRCVVSGEKLRPGEEHFFSPSAGGVLLRTHRETQTSAFAVSESTIKLMRLFLSNSLESLGRIRVDEADLLEIRQVTSRFFAWIKG